MRPLELVRRELLSTFAADGMRLARYSEHHQDGPVDLLVRDLCIRLDRDRTVFGVRFSARFDSDWFDAAEVRACLGRQGPDVASTDATVTVARLRECLAADLDAIAHLFAPEQYPDARLRMLEWRRARNERLAAGPTPGASC